MNPSIARLTQLVPPPSEVREKDWASAEQELGVGLPLDYKELIHTYGGSNWDDYLYVLEPGCPNDNYDLIEWEDQQTEALDGLWEFEKKPRELQDEGTRVIPWATTDNGECLYWLARPGQEPDQWTIMVNEARGERWEHYSTTCTQFLADVLQGELRSTILSSRFPLSTHEFRQLQPV
ncbi:SMI1/KNR4 family protein [Streptomyces sp. ISL-100]|uniref:SMI1/KNR4 family protein n=1 Tax=Streptomyces sp. ISL-100 TaxID=2819173 RepID=UPI001BEB1666|nr:SMI1/KNR4 family protein [Streptomyces sp. ISL-100]MBT2401456.1 SMI1/KNR4 family protein [Streptomyces sp. ISL-100]